MRNDLGCMIFSCPAFSCRQYPEQENAGQNYTIYLGRRSAIVRRVTPGLLALWAISHISNPCSPSRLSSKSMSAWLLLTNFVTKRYSHFCDVGGFCVVCAATSAAAGLERVPRDREARCLPSTIALRMNPATKSTNDERN